MVPLAKTGGLADVLGVLPRKLKEKGCDVRVVMPYYKEAEKNLKRLKYKSKFLKEEVIVTIDWLPYRAKIKEATVDEVSVYLLSNNDFFYRNYLYTPPGGDYTDNDIRFGFLSIGALEIAKALNFKPDIIHCNDWQSAMAPISLRWKKHYNDDPFFKNSKVVFTIHNIAYQGIFASRFLDKFGLSHSLFNTEQLEYYGNVNLLKGAIISSDLVTTVSPTYAKEVKTKEYGYGLDGVLRALPKEKLAGIINGVDYDEWNPETDKGLYANYSLNDVSGKYKNKAKLMKQLGLNSKGSKPLIGLVARLALQKGIDLVVDSLEELMALGVDLVVLGTGDARYEKLLVNAESKYKQSFKAIIGYNEVKARRIYAGCDMFLMPSRFEPCGLGQLISLRYGTIPIVRGTGGLLDTIIDHTESKEAGNGFIFHEFEGKELIGAVKRALTAYDNEEEWSRMVETAMSMDFSWRKSSDIYVEHYKKLLEQT